MASKKTKVEAVSGAVSLERTPAGKVPKAPAVPASITSVLGALPADRSLREIEQVEPRPGSGCVVLASTFERRDGGSYRGADIVVATNAGDRVVQADVASPQITQRTGGRSAISVDPSGRFALYAGREVLQRVDLESGDVGAVWGFDGRGFGPHEAAWIAGGRIAALTQDGIHILGPTSDDVYERLDFLPLPRLFWHLAASHDGAALVVTAFGDDRQTDKPEIRVYGAAAEDLVLAAKLQDKAEAPVFRGSRCFVRQGRATSEVVGAHAAASEAVKRADARPHRERALASLRKGPAEGPTLVPVEETATRPDLPPSARALLAVDPWAIVMPLGGRGAAVAARLDPSIAKGAPPQAAPGADWAVGIHAMGEEPVALPSYPRKLDLPGLHRPFFALSPDGQRMLVGSSSDGAPLVEVDLATSTSTVVEHFSLRGAAYLDSGRILCLDDSSDLRILDRATGSFTAPAGSFMVMGRSAPMGEAGLELAFSRGAGIAIVRTAGCEGLLYAVRGDELVRCGSLPGPVLALRSVGPRVFADVRGVWCEILDLERVAPR